jgi:hypothetical protein
LGPLNCQKEYVDTPILFLPVFLGEITAGNEDSPEQDIPRPVALAATIVF